MLPIERQQQIVEQVQLKSSVRVVDLADEYAVTGETIRRDLEALEQRGLLRRVYGGAVHARQDAVQLYRDRETHRIAEKQAIARAAVDMIHDGDAIILDVGTTAFALCQQLHMKHGLTVITPSLQAAMLLKQTTDARVIVSGGELQGEEPYLSGPLAQGSLQQFHVQTAFIGVGGVAMDVGLTDYDSGEVELRKVMMTRAAHVVVLSDASKIGVRALHVIGPLTRMDTLITDASVAPEFVQSLEDTGVHVICAPLAAPVKE